MRVEAKPVSIRFDKSGFARNEAINRLIKRF